MGSAPLARADRICAFNDAMFAASVLTSLTMPLILSSRPLRASSMDCDVRLNDCASDCADETAAVRDAESDGFCATARSDE